MQEIHCFVSVLSELAGHMERFKQSEQFGLIGKQTCCPNPTNRMLISHQHSLQQK